MTPKRLRNIFVEYLKELPEIKSFKFKQIINDYLDVFSELFEIYDCKKHIRVFTDERIELCRIVLFVESKYEGVDFITKDIKIKPTEIYFSKNCIFIERQFNLENFNPIKSLFDLSEIKLAIQEAELDRLS